MDRTTLRRFNSRLHVLGAKGVRKEIKGPADNKQRERTVIVAVPWSRTALAVESVYPVRLQSESDDENVHRKVRFMFPMPVAKIHTSY